MSLDPSDQSTPAERAVAALQLDCPATGPGHTVLKLMMEAVSPATDEAFFSFLVEKIATTLGVNWVFVTECLDFPTTSVSMLASWRGGDVGHNVDFGLAGTPCDEVINEGKVCFYPKNIIDRFPREKRHGQESYIGVPIFERGGTRVIGHIAIFDKKDMTDGILRDEFLADTVLRIFAERAGAEIQRMQLIRELRNSAESYRLIVDNQDEFVVRIDAKGDLLFVSPSYCNALGKSADDLIGTRFSIASQLGVSDSDETTDVRPPREAPLSRFEEPLRTQAGLRWIDWSPRSVADSGNSLDRQMVVVGRDITVQRDAEENARAHFRKLAHVARRSSLNEMSSAIAHEVNQPLASILTYAQACLRLSAGSIENKRAIEDALRSIASNAERAGAVIKRLRSFARDGIPQRKSINANQLVRDVIALMRLQASRHSIEFELALDDAAGVINVDVIQIEQVLVNLIQNAFDSIRKSSSAMRTVCVHTIRPSEREVQIVVKDLAEGVAPSIAPSIFDPFITTKPDGLGIGLSISKSIVEAHDGWLSFEPALPTGAQFCLAIPSHE
ncbi:MAG: ATP-binding protein [Burkholderiaceae bacterium]